MGMKAPLVYRGIPKKLLAGMRPKYMTTYADEGIRTRWHKRVITKKCVEKGCKNKRRVFLQNAHEVKRCLACQWKFRNSLSRHLRAPLRKLKVNEPGMRPAHDKIFMKHRMQGLPKNEKALFPSKDKPIVKTNQKLNGYERSNWRRNLPAGSEDLSQRYKRKPRTVESRTNPGRKIYL